MDFSAAVSAVQALIGLALVAGTVIMTAWLSCSFAIAESKWLRGAG